jgi:hypothetical protein
MRRALNIDTKLAPLVQFLSLKKPLEHGGSDTADLTVRPKSFCYSSKLEKQTREGF